MDLDKENVLDHNNVCGSVCHSASSVESSGTMAVEELGGKDRREI